MKKETLTTIAQRTGLSTTTVSRVLNGFAHKYRISEKTCNIVRQEAQKCHYLPGNYSHVLRDGKSKMIGLLLPSISNPFFAEIAGNVITEMDKSAYTTIIMDTRENAEVLSDCARSLIARQVEGLIIAPCGNDPTDIELMDKKLPVVLIDRYFKETGLSYVTTNNYQAALNATRKIIAKGHRKIACIQGVVSSMPNSQRVKGYLDAMAEAGLQDNCHVVGEEFSVKNGYIETKMLLNQDKGSTAIFALSGTIMLGTVKAIHEAGLKIPDNIAVLCFDDNIHMDFLTPSITRMAQPVADMAALACKIMMEKLNGDKQLKSQIELTATYVQGESL